MPTRMTVQLADRSIKHPRGVIENFLLKIEQFIFPVDIVILDMVEDIFLVDFVILDMVKDSNIPLILGRPFLFTAKALIDLESGILTLRVGEENVTFKVSNSPLISHTHNNCLYAIESLNPSNDEYSDDALKEGD